MTFKNTLAINQFCSIMIAIWLTTIVVDCIDFNAIVFFHSVLDLAMEI